MKYLLALVALCLPGCVTLNHTLSDGTHVRVTPNSVHVSSGKSTIDLTLPRK